MEGWIVRIDREDLASEILQFVLLFIRGCVYKALRQVCKLETAGGDQMNQREIMIDLNHIGDIWKDSKTYASIFILKTRIFNIEKSDSEGNYSIYESYVYRSFITAQIMGFSDLFRCSSGVCEIRIKIRDRNIITYFS